MFLLDNPIQAYDWGPTDGIAALVGSAPTGAPEAELWVGTHPRGPSIVAAGPRRGTPLSEVVAEDPGRWLGAALAGAGATELPFLLKVLAVGAPLSLQAHPSAAQARAGFAREDAAGIPLDAPERIYRDASAKPEALVALRTTKALCGFRAADEAARLVGALDAPALRPLLERLRAPRPDDALRRALVWLLHLEGDDRGAVADAATAAAPRRGDEPWRSVLDLAERYPGDPGCLAPLLLEVVELAPDEAVHLPAGNLHAYLDGAGVEIMASSDNVLRGGLTSKHVDVDELLAVLRFEPGIPALPPACGTDALTIYDAHEDAFGLVRIAPGPARAIELAAPSLLLPVGGPAQVGRKDVRLDVAPGQAVFAAPGEQVLVSSEVPVWWATTGAGLPGA